GVVSQRLHHARVAALQPGHRADIDDPTALPALDHVQADRAAHEERAVDVGAHDLVPGLERDVLEARAPGRPGVVDPDVDVVPGLKHLVDGGLDVLGFRDVAPYR